MIYTKLEGTKYNSLNSRGFGRSKDLFRIYHADFVSDEYTGLVHIVPEHGLDDLKLSKKLKIIHLIYAISESGEAILFKFSNSKLPKSFI
jgi:isoleucyl-tRNA synthetase